MKKSEKERATEFRSEEFTPLGSSQDRFVKTWLTSGTTSFTTFAMQIKPSENAAIEPRSAATIGLTYQAFCELQADHGDAITYGILGNAGLLLLSDAKRATLRQELFEASDPKVHDKLAKLLTRCEAQGVYDSALTAYWAEIKAQQLSDLWLAAMARYALEVEGNEFAFGYLSSLLDARHNHEADALRGKATQAAAAAGGRRRSLNRDTKTRSILLEMKHYIDRGRTVTDAARFAHKNGHGKSEAANRAVWYRRSDKPD